MRAESWMDRTPKPPSPLQRVRADLKYWSERVQSLNNDLFEAEKQFIEASQRLDALEGRGVEP